MKIYFAGAIRGGRGDAALYLQIVESLREYGEVLTEHVADEKVTEFGEANDDPWIHDRDFIWLKEADCLVAEVTTPSLGVGYEIGKFTEWGRHVLCLHRPGNNRMLSALIAGNPQLVVRNYQRAADVKEIFDDFFATR